MAFDNSDLLVDDLHGVVIYGVQEIAGAINVKYGTCNCPTLYKISTKSIDF